MSHSALTMPLILISRDHPAHAGCWPPRASPPDHDPGRTRHAACRRLCAVRKRVHQRCALAHTMPLMHRCLLHRTVCCSLSAVNTC
jgi:hypothetical protein